MIEKVKSILNHKLRNKKIGLMFGPESSGLSNNDLSYSNFVVQIPSHKNFKSDPVTKISLKKQYDSI